MIENDGLVVFAGTTGVLVQVDGRRMPDAAMEVLIAYSSGRHVAPVPAQLYRADLMAHDQSGATRWITSRGRRLIDAIYAESDSYPVCAEWARSRGMEVR